MPHPKLRSAAKWAATASAITLLTTWLASGWWTLDWRWTSTTVTHRLLVIAGCIHTQRLTGSTSPFHSTNFPGNAILQSRTPAQSSPFWWWQSAPITFDEASPGSFSFPFPGARLGSTSVIPLWPPFLATATLAIIFWRLDILANRRARAGLCPHCKYDRTGLATRTLCPECGQSPLAST